MAVEVISQIEIKNNPALPVVAASRIVGGTGWLVPDNTARDAIDVSSREVGMEVKVLSPLAYFKLEADLTTWTEVVFTGFVETGDIGVTVAPLVDGKVPADNIQSIFLNNSTIDANEAAMLARTTLTGDFSVRTDDGNVYVKLNNNGPTSVIGDWQVLNSPGVTTVNGQTGGVSIDFDTLLLYSTSLAQFNAAVIASDYAGTTNAAISAINTTLSTLGLDSHTHDNKPLLDALLSTGSAGDYLSADGTYVTLHTHSNKSAIDKVIDDGNGTIFLANDGNYKALPAGLGEAPTGSGIGYVRKDSAWVPESGGGGGGDLEIMVMFESNLDNRRILMQYGPLSFISIVFDTVAVSGITYETATTAGSTWTEQASLAALNAYAEAAPARWYLRITVAYRDNITQPSGALLTYTRTIP
jgi:hypothetical protein